jgi:hypothetical protein
MIQGFNQYYRIPGMLVRGANEEQAIAKAVEMLLTLKLTSECSEEECKLHDRLTMEVYRDNDLRLALDAKQASGWPKEIVQQYKVLLFNPGWEHLKRECSLSTGEMAKECYRMMIKLEEYYHNIPAGNLYLITDSE